MSLLRASPLFLFSLILVAVSGEQTTTTTTVKPTGSAHGTVHVDIWNKYPGVELKVHCRSKDKDAGEHGGGHDADIVSFSFLPSLWGNTRFYCTVTRSPGQGKVVFDVYNFDRDADGRCASQCTWYVKPDGVHGLDALSGEEDLFFPWV